MAVEGLMSVIDPVCVTVILAGVAIGIIFGSIPGLTSNMAVALGLPLTFTLTPVQGIAMVIALYVGGVSGGLIASILLKIPGTPASVATVFDGGPMADRGEAGRALAIGVLYSFLGTVLSIAALIFIAPVLARVALRFGPYEYFAIGVFALTMIGGMIGDSLLKGLICGTFGITMSLVGIAAIGGARRFTFGIPALENGFALLPALIGLFAVAEILRAAAEGMPGQGGKTLTYAMKGLGVSRQEFKEQLWNFFRSALIGIGIGILPGIGAATSNILAYTVAKNRSKHPEKFGTGIIDGIIASETANNSSIGGALIPLLTLGIPGDSVTAMILGGLTLHGIFPGPLLFKTSGVLVYGIFSSFIIATFAMAFMMYCGMRGFVKVLSVPKYALLPLIMALCVVGSYGVNHSMFDVWTALVFGIIGFAMSRHNFPMTPVILGLVLGPIIERNLISGLMIARNDFWRFFGSPIAVVFLSASALIVLRTSVTQIRRKPPMRGET